MFVARVGDAGGGGRAWVFPAASVLRIIGGAFLHPRVPFAFQLVFGGFLFPSGSVSAQPPITATGMRNRTRNFFCSLAMGRSFCVLAENV